MELKKTIKDDTIRLYSADKELLWMREEMNDTNITIYVGGDLASETMYEFSDEILALVSLKKDIVLDLEKVNYITASCMKALLTIQVKIDKNKKGSLCLKNIPDSIYQEFKKNGMSELLWIE